MDNPSIASLAARLGAAPARAEGTRVVLIDGPAGSGKTTLGDRLGAALGAQVLHADDMYEGWTGLATLDSVLVGQVLEPLARGDRAGFRRWDWHASARAERIDVRPAPSLVIEGVGVASRAARPFASLVIFVDAPWETRLARGIERDGEAMRGEWTRWHDAEDRHFAAERTRAEAEVQVDGEARVHD